MSRIRANKITNKAGTGAIEMEKGAHLPVGMGITGAGAINISGAITGGVITGSSFSGDGSGLIGVASTDNIITGTAATFNTMPVDINAGMTVAGVSTMAAITATTGTFSGNVSVGGVLTYEDVTNVDSVGLITARSGINVSGGVITAQAGQNKIPFLYNALTDLPNAGTYHGMFAHVHSTQRGYFAHGGGWYQLINKEANNIVGTGTETYNVGVLTATTLYGNGANLTGISVGITTEALTTAGNTVTLDLSKDDHKITKSGTYTITCTGGSEASAHTLRIVNSGIATVGFSTYFLFPSGGVPNLPTANGAISLISFTVHRAGAVGVSTQLLSGASLNFS
tara:strand:+ start:1426 stop:2442 length:1017 start_codon:yes stop_codon:yes gene_type:complete